jgi:hypothetical protein
LSKIRSGAALSDREGAVPCRQPCPGVRRCERRPLSTVAVFTEVNGRRQSTSATGGRRYGATLGKVLRRRTGHETIGLRGLVADHTGLAVLQRFDRRPGSEDRGSVKAGPGTA